MADALPPNQAQIVVLKSLKGDVERVLQQARPKEGEGVSPATVVQVRQWLADAAKSTEDAPLPLTEKPVNPGEPSLDSAGVVASVRELGTRFEARAEQLKKEPTLASVPLDAWLTQTVVEVTKARAHKTIKAGQVKAVSLEELKNWLARAGFEAGSK